MAHLEIWQFYYVDDDHVEISLAYILPLSHAKRWNNNNLCSKGQSCTAHLLLAYFSINV